MLEYKYSPMNIAIIPARGGSKRIPRKNIRSFLGKPIMAYSIEAAIKAKIFDKVMVSTDDVETSQIAKAYGADVPFLRSKKNSDDKASLVDVILEVLQKYKKIKQEYNIICCFLPTAPFVTHKLLQESLQLLLKNKNSSVVPVVRFESPIQRAFKIQNGKLKMLWPEYMFTRSNDLPVCYHDAGQFYFLNTSQFIKEKKLFGQTTIPIERPLCFVQDIDSEEDWLLGEIKYRMAYNV